MNLECSNEIKENVFNNEVVLVKIENEILCFSVSFIKELIDQKPFLVKQLGEEDETRIFNDHPVNAVVKPSFFLRQKDGLQQILLLKDNIAVDHEFISSFQSGRNTFELSNPEVVWLFKDVKKYSVKTFLYKTKTIQRKNLLQNQEINEEIRSKLQDDYTMTRIKKETSISEPKTPRKKCLNDSYFNADEIVFNENLIMIFQEGSPSNVYCYSINELERLIQAPIDQKKKKELDNGAVIIKIDYTNLWIDIISLQMLIEKKVNTIMLSKREGNQGIYKYEYFIPIESSRKELFPDNDFSNEISASFELNQTEYHDDGEFRYRKRHSFYFDENTGEVIPDRIYSTEWIRYNKNNINAYLRHSYKDEPAYTQFDLNQHKIKEEYIYEDGKDTIKRIISFYENGNKKEEEWFDSKDNYLQRKDDLPNAIEYYENGNKKIEEWYQNDMLNRDNDLPSAIHFYKNGNKKHEVWYNQGVVIKSILYYENETNKKQMERWYDEDKKSHREGDLPAVITYHENGNRKKDFFYNHGVLIKSIAYYNNETNKKQTEKWLDEDKKLNREGDLPTVIFYYKNGNKERESWYKNNVLIKSIFYSENEKKEKEEWYDEYKNIHREGDLPAVIWYYENGTKERESWYKNGIYHRDDRDSNSENKETNFPAIIEYYENGLYKRKQWYRNGKLNRDNNLPQDVFYYNNGRLQREMWWSNNNNIKKKIFYKEDGHGYISENGTITNF